MATPFIETILSTANKIGHGIHTGFVTSGMAKPLASLSGLASKHVRLFIKIVLVAYSALALYNIFYIQPLEFFPREQHFLSISKILIVGAQVSIISIGLFGIFTGSKKYTRIVSIVYDNFCKTIQLSNQ